MIPRPPISTRTYPLVPYTTLFRSVILVRVVSFIFSVGIAFNLGKNVIQVKVAVIVDAEAAVRIAIGQCIVKECRVERGGIAFLVLVLGRKHLAEIQGKDKQAG